ncbi:MAG: hotdog fold thioesterase [Chitinophagales bacterium]|nr:hotdog fold thioesterase [Chitinophagales bacterium]
MVAPTELYINVIENLIPFNKLLNIQLVEIREGFAKLKVPFKPELIGDPRRQAIHGGVISTLMDTAGGAAGMTTLVSFEDALSTIDIRVDYLRPAKAMDLVVESEIVRSGNRIIVTRMIAYQEDIKQPIAEGKGVYNVKRHAKEHKTSNQ